MRWEITNRYSLDVVQELLHPPQERPQLVLVDSGGLGGRLLLIRGVLLRLLRLQLAQAHLRLRWNGALWFSLKFFPRPVRQHRLLDRRLVLHPLAPNRVYSPLRVVLAPLHPLYVALHCQLFPRPPHLVDLEVVFAALAVFVRAEVSARQAPAGLLLLPEQVGDLDRGLVFDAAWLPRLIRAPTLSPALDVVASALVPLSSAELVEIVAPIVLVVPVVPGRREAPGAA